LKYNQLRPAPLLKYNFHHADEKYILSRPGCYCIADNHSVILYIGKATSLLARFKTHVMDREKRISDDGRIPKYFVCLQRDDITGIERGWLNSYICECGCLPPFNKIAAS